jgi:hypothetical protein
MTFSGKALIYLSPYTAGKTRHIHPLSLDIQPLSVKSGYPAVELFTLYI